MGEIAVSLAPLEPVIEVAYRLFEDGVRRWRDIDFAEWLGLEQPRNIRQTIEANLKRIKRHGSMHAVRASVPGGGKTYTEYWLNFEQAMVLCNLSRTPRAEDVSTVMIKVFTKVTHGELSTGSRMDMRALEVLAKEIVAPIINAVLDRMDRQEQRFEQRFEHQDRLIGSCRTTLVEVQKQNASVRREFSRETRDLYIRVVATRYNNLCPCCHHTVVTPTDGPVLGEVDHWFHPSKRKTNEGWLICRECNSKLRDSTFKQSKNQEFHLFQEMRKTCEPNGSNQLALFIQ